MSVENLVEYINWLMTLPHMHKICIFLYFIWVGELVLSLSESFIFSYHTALDNKMVFISLWLSSALCHSYLNILSLLSSFMYCINQIFPTSFHPEPCGKLAYKSDFLQHCNYMLLTLYPPFAVNCFARHTQRSLTLLSVTTSNILFFLIWDDPCITSVILLKASIMQNLITRL